MTPQDRAIVGRYRDHLARFQALQQVSGSTWTDATVAEAMAPHRSDAEQALYRRGFTRDQVTGLLAEPAHSPGRPRPSANT
jgi:hypothetical protein